MFVANTEKDIVERIANNVRNLRLAKEVSQDELASGCDVRRETINRIERRKTKRLSISLLSDMANYFKIDAKDLLNTAKENADSYTNKYGLTPDLINRFMEECSDFRRMVAQLRIAVACMDAIERSTGIDRDDMSLNLGLTRGTGRGPSVISFHLGGAFYEVAVLMDAAPYFAEDAYLTGRKLVQYRCRPEDFTWTENATAIIAIPLKELNGNDDFAFIRRFDFMAANDPLGVKMPSENVLTELHGLGRDIGEFEQLADDADDATNRLFSKKTNRAVNRAKLLTEGCEPVTGWAYHRIKNRWSIRNGGPVCMVYPPERPYSTNIGDLL